MPRYCVILTRSRALVEHTVVVLTSSSTDEKTISAMALTAAPSSIGWSTDAEKVTDAQVVHVQEVGVPS